MKLREGLLNGEEDVVDVAAGAGAGYTSAAAGAAMAAEGAGVIGDAAGACEGTGLMAENAEWDPADAAGECDARTGDADSGECECECACAGGAAGDRGAGGDCSAATSDRRLGGRGGRAAERGGESSESVGGDAAAVISVCSALDGRREGCLLLLLFCVGVASACKLLCLLRACGWPAASVAAAATVSPALSAWNPLLRGGCDAGRAAEITAAAAMAFPLSCALVDSDPAVDGAADGGEGGATVAREGVGSGEGESILVTATRPPPTLSAPFWPWRYDRIKERTDVLRSMSAPVS